MQLSAERLVAACGDGSFEAAISMRTELEPVSGRGQPVKPAVYEGGRYQIDKRWRNSDDVAPTEVVVIDNVASQANRLEAALLKTRASTGLPELVLDLSGFDLPPHLPRALSSWQFPHRHADAYVRDAMLGDEAFAVTALGKSLVEATAQNAAALLAWFPQSLLFGYWQSHLGRKRSQSKHARAWVSEIVGWSPASTETRVLGLKGDALNLNTDETVTSNPDDRIEWEFGKAKIDGGKSDRLSEMGHGQVPFMRDSDAAMAGISFREVVQTSTVSLAQLRRISLGSDSDDERDAAARALLVAMGLVAHCSAFGRGFALRSGADLQPVQTTMTFVGSNDPAFEPLALDTAMSLFDESKVIAEAAGISLAGWDTDSVVLTPKPNVAKAIESTWPKLDD